MSQVTWILRGDDRRRRGDIAAKRRVDALTALSPQAGPVERERVDRACLDIGAETNLAHARVVVSRFAVIIQLLTAIGVFGVEPVRGARPERASIANRRDPAIEIAGGDRDEPTLSRS
jgi:hypothetical protein